MSLICSRGIIESKNELVMSALSSPNKRSNGSGVNRLRPNIPREREKEKNGRRRNKRSIFTREKSGEKTRRNGRDERTHPWNIQQTSSFFSPILESAHTFAAKSSARAPREKNTRRFSVSFSRDTKRKEKTTSNSSRTAQRTGALLGFAERVPESARNE